MKKIGKALLKVLGEVVITVVVLPILLVAMVIYLPIQYIRFKRSRYQKDFPRKASFGCGPHVDNTVYTIVKERELPIRYFRQNHLNYDEPGWFLYNDILLDFTDPVFFDKERNICPSRYEEQDVETAGGPLSVDAQKRETMDAFHRHEPDQPCTRVVFFINQSSAEDMYDDAGMEELRTSDDFVLYTKKTLADQLEKFIREN